MSPHCCAPDYGDRWEGPRGGVAGAGLARLGWVAGAGPRRWCPPGGGATGPGVAWRRGRGGGTGLGVGPRCREAAGDRRAGWRARTGAASGLYDRWSAMAASPVSGGGGAGAVHSCNTSGFAFDSGLEIRTRSVEQTLLPLVSQVLRPRVPVCAARDGGCRFSLARHGGAGGGAVPHSVSAATARRDWRGGPGRGGPGRALRRPNPAGALSGLGGPTRLALRLLPREAQRRDGGIPAGSPGF